MTDLRVLPVLALLFLCSFLDRTNVGNAKIIGLEKDLGITDLQYTQGLAVFYATYIARCVRRAPPPLNSDALPCETYLLTRSVSCPASSRATSSSRKSRPRYGSPA